MSIPMTREAAATLSVGSSAVARPNLLSRIVSAIAREIRIRRDMRLLASFDDVALHDLGLARGGMEDAVRNGRPRTSELVVFDQPLRDTPNPPIVPMSFTEWR
ncbi:DUF1127 domain-containing protein [Microvirga alba]|uniref:DUF1127 domain-containing protein n=1 Tax=Microvirga alba TaxID=2791025 RepID=A0A931BRA8_9HYPH|nr:DUF1127 domain-containing protein [Microvirga alba]MBF9233790.1 hypothetical protein [Microvirga alba]